MVSRTSDTQKIEDIKYLAKGDYTLTMSQNDTFTASDFVTTENLKSATLIQISDGSVLTNTIANNVVTCTSAVTNQKCALCVVGVRA